MKNQYQLRGNGCIQACLATLLEIPIVSVPSFMDVPDNPEAKYPGWHAAIQEFVRQFGFAFIEVALQDRIWFPVMNEVLCIFMGPLEDGTKHAIVGKCADGNFFPIFDPLGKDNASFTTVESVCFLVPLDPMTQMRMGKALEEVEATSRGVSNRILGESIRDTCREALGKKVYGAPSILGPDGSILNPSSNGQG